MGNIFNLHKSEEKFWKTNVNFGEIHHEEGLEMIHKVLSKMGTSLYHNLLENCQVILQKSTYQSFQFNF